MLDSLGLSPAGLTLTFASYFSVLLWQGLRKDEGLVIPHFAIGLGLVATLAVVSLLAQIAGIRAPECLLLRRAPWIPALAGLAALITPRLSRSWGNRGVLACAFGLLALASTTPLISPLLERNRTSAPGWENDVCRQSVPFTCTAAAGATLLRSLGVSSSEDEVAILSGTDPRGTDLLGLAAGVRSKLDSAMTVRAAVLDVEDLRSVQLPCVAFSKCHAFVVFAIDEVTDEVEIGDSTAPQGRLSVSWERLEQRFQGEVLLVTSADASGVIDGSEFEILPGHQEGFDSEGLPLRRFGSANAEPW